IKVIFHLYVAIEIERQSFIRGCYFYSPIGQVTQAGVERSLFTAPGCGNVVIVRDTRAKQDILPIGILKNDSFRWVDGISDTFPSFVQFMLVFRCQVLSGVGGPVAKVITGSDTELPVKLNKLSWEFRSGC